MLILDLQLANFVYNSQLDYCRIKIVSKMAGGIAAKHIHHLVRAIGFMNQPRLGLVGYLKKNIKHQSVFIVGKNNKE